MANERESISCPQCQMLSIQGLPCHETGCPNQNKVWKDGEWVKMYECPECENLCDTPEEAYQCCTREYSDIHEEWTEEDEAIERAERIIHNEDDTPED